MSLKLIYLKKGNKFQNLSNKFKKKNTGWGLPFNNRNPSTKREKSRGFTQMQSYSKFKDILSQVLYIYN